MNKRFYCAIMPAPCVVTPEEVAELQKQEIETLQDKIAQQQEEIASLQIKRAAAIAVFDMLLAGEEVDESLVLAARNL